MAHIWSFHRLLGPAPDRELFTRVADVVRLVRAADPATLWSFVRLPGGLGVSFHSTADVDRLLRTVVGGEWTVAADRHEPPTDKYRDARTMRLATELAAVSSDLALAVLCSGPPDRSLAVWHLAGLTELVPESERDAFLFHCWQHWARTQSPGARLELTAEAHRWPGCAEHHQGLRPFVDRAHELVGGADRPTVKFLMFDHAQLSHERLGLADSTAALAAGVLRAGRMLAPELQTV